ncbi:hypothetical protein D3C76_1416170 [compost metagenome]
MPVEIEKFSVCDITILDRTRPLVFDGTFNQYVSVNRTFRKRNISTRDNTIWNFVFELFIYCNTSVVEVDCAPGS